MRVKQLVWTPNDRVDSYTSAWQNIEIYRAGDSWRVSLSWAGEPIRNLPSKEAAIEEANKQWREWIMEFIEE